MEELNQVPMAELTKVIPSIACGPAESAATRMKNSRSRRRRPAPGLPQRPLADETGELEDGDAHEDQREQDGHDQGDGSRRRVRAGDGA